MRDGEKVFKGILKGEDARVQMIWEVVRDRLAKVMEGERVVGGASDVVDVHGCGTGVFIRVGHVVGSC